MKAPFKGDSEMKKILLLALMVGATIASVTSRADCWAYTTCADGHQISCWASGDGCTWNWVAGTSVYCTGPGGSWGDSC